MKEGDWADCFEGIGQIVSIHEIYADGLDIIDNPKHKLGEHLMDIVVYKMFCDFEGKLRKRSHFLSCNKSLCSPLCRESRTVLNKAKAQAPDIYEKHKKLNAKKAAGDWCYLYLPSDESFAFYKEKIEEIGHGISKPFTFSQYKEALNKVGFTIARRNVETSIEKQYVTLSFFNEGYLSKNRERLYSRVNCTVIGPYA